MRELGDSESEREQDREGGRGRALCYELSWKASIFSDVPLRIWGRFIDIHDTNASLEEVLAKI